MVAEDVSLYWDGGAWQWNEELKDDDITVDTDNTSLDNDITPDVTVTESGSDGAAILAGSYTVTWNGTSWDTPATAANGQAASVTGTADGCVLEIDGGGEARIFPP
jgi:hypothetical protein